jgi:signal transduction histidine kinase/PAS domain-containing protein/ActR/RegA family two-component response regulator
MMEPVFSARKRLLQPYLGKLRQARLFFFPPQKRKPNALTQREFEAEKSIAPVRVAICASGVFYFFLFMETEGLQSWGVFSFIFSSTLYALYSLLFEPYLRYSKVFKSHIISLLDSLLIVVWLSLSSGTDTPFYPLIYCAILAVALRHGFRATLIASTIYSLFYILLIFALNAHEVTFDQGFLRVIYIFFIGALGGTLAERSLTQRTELSRFNESLRQEILERRKAERALVESQKKLNFTLKAAEVATWSWNQQTEDLEWSDQFEIMHEIKDISFKNGKNLKRFFKRIHSADRKKTRQKIQKAIKNHKEYSLRYRYFTPENKIKWFESKGKASYDVNGNPQRISGICIDITNKIQNELQIEKAFQQRMAIAEISQQAIYETNISQLMDKALTRLKQTLQGDLVSLLKFSKKTNSFRIEKSYGRVYGPIQRVPANKNSQAGFTLLASQPKVKGNLQTHEPLIVSDLENETRFKAETLYSEGIRSGMSVIVYGNDHPYGVLEVHSRFKRAWSPDEAKFFQSVGNVLAAAIQRSRLEKELRSRVQELAQADQNKNEFLAMLAHELRHPLAPICSAVGVLKESGQFDSQGVLALEAVERKVQNMTHLIDDLLDVSRVTRGKIQLKKSHINLVTVLNRSIEACQSIIQSKGHLLQFTHDDAEILTYADPIRLEQVFTNILNNAAKYTPSGGQIKVTLSQKGGAAQLYFEDSGLGMTSEMCAKAFDLFTQAEQSLDRSEGGLGIGLTMAKRLLELHGGKIQVMSDGRGKGSTFNIHLPLAQPPANQCMIEDVSLTTKSYKTSSLFPKKILLVDDDPDMLQFLAMLLEIWGYEVKTTPKAHEALPAVQEFQPDIVFLDIGLPQMSGYEVAKILRSYQAQEEVTHFPLLIALTGYGRREDQEKALQAGFDRHLTKPITQAALKAFLGQENEILKPQPPVENFQV